MAKHIKQMMDLFLADMPSHEDRMKSKGPHVTADWLLVNCIDCRYPHAIHNFMLTEHQNEPYDQLVLAGASLAGTEVFSKKKSWEETFADHVYLSIKMHKIFGVLILNHRTCGAFREVNLLTADDEIHRPQLEFETHKRVAESAAEIVLRQFEAHRRDGFVHVYLTPKLNPGDVDFSDRPEELCKKTYRV